MNRISPDIRAEQFKLVAGELHVWIADLDACDANDGRARHQDRLSAEERERAARFIDRRDGRRWAHSRALLRSLAGSYLGADPAELRFQLGEHGKPRFASATNRAAQSTLAGAELHFNLSHSDDHGLYVFALDCEVGCDIETGGRDIDLVAVAERAFGQEMAERLRLLDGKPREHEFLRAWVRREARLKCSGLELRGPAKSASDRECWIGDVDVGTRASAAIAAQGAPAKVEYRRSGAMCSLLS